MNDTKLENWSIQGDKYTATEIIRLRLVGKVYNHPKADRHYDGKEIITSYIKEVHGTTVITSSGTTYVLGEIDSNYKQWLEDNNYSYDPNNPIKELK